jgi:hypothetical protein
MAVFKWVLVTFALVALGLVVTAKVIAFMNPPRPGRAEVPALRRVRRALLWTVLLPVVLGVAVLAMTIAWGR